MKISFFIIYLLLCYSVSAQTSSGINWDRYFITGSLAVGQGNKNVWAHDALLLQIGKDTNTRGIRIPWVLDTINVASPRPFGTEVGQLKDSTKYVWLGNRWSSGKLASSNLDTTSLSNRIDQRVKYSDTAVMLTPYATKANLKDTAATLRGLIGSTVSALMDTATSLRGAINQRVKYTDTAAMLAPYATKSALTDTAGTLRALINVGGANTVKYADTASMLSPYARKQALQDTAVLIRNTINTKVGYTDTAAMLSPYASKVKVLSDSAALAAQINQRVKYTDTASILLPYARKSALNDTSVTLRAAINTKAPLASPTFTGTATVEIITGLQFAATIQTLTDGSTTTWNVNNGGQAIWTIGGTGRTLSISNPIAGSFYTIKLIQGSGGSKTVTTWPTNTKWPSGNAPVLSTAAGSVDIVSLWYDGTNYNANYSLDIR